VKLKIIAILIFFAFFVFSQSKNYDRFADSMVAAGQSEKLIDFFRQEDKKKPNNEDITRWLGYLHLIKNDADNTIKYYLAALKINPNCGMCYVNLAKAYLIKTDYQSSLRFCNKAIEIEPENSVFIGLRGEIKAMSGDGLGAGFDFDKAVQMDDKNYENFLRRGLFDSKKGMFSSALMDFTKATELNPGYYRCWFEKASIEFNLQQYPEALEDINKAIELDSIRPELYTGRAAIYAVISEHNLAIADYSKSIQIEPKNYYAYYYRSLEKYALEDMDAACIDINEAMSIAGNKDTSFVNQIKYSADNFCDSTQAEFYYQRGIASFNLKNYEQALKFYNSGLKKFPEHTYLISFRGNAFFALKKYKDAIADYEMAVSKKENVKSDLNPQKRKFYEEKNYLDKFTDGLISSDLYLMSASYFIVGDFEKAMNSIIEAIKIAPEVNDFGKENYLNLRGCIYLISGKNEEAIKDFNQCIELNPDFENSYVNKAVAILCNEIKPELQTEIASGGVDKDAFNPSWKIPYEKIKKISKEKIKETLEYCEKAIKINPVFPMAYYISGMVKKFKGDSEYCKDLIQAHKMKYEVEMKLINKCLK
jgi:tetratricopeptide (TPR) repeat protein